MRIKYGKLLWSDIHSCNMPQTRALHTAYIHYIIHDCLGAFQATFLQIILQQTVWLSKSTFACFSVSSIIHVQEWLSLQHKDLTSNNLRESFVCLARRSRCIAYEVIHATSNSQQGCTIYCCFHLTQIAWHEHISMCMFVQVQMCTCQY